MAGADEAKKWNIIYPQYVNANLTTNRGRRLGKSRCVSDPTTEEIYNVLSANQNFQAELNVQKCYTRELDKESAKNRGCVKYVCSDASLKNKRQVLAYVAQMIPKLKSRQNPKPSEQKASSSGASVSNLLSSQSGGGGGKKKNRRR